MNDVAQIEKSPNVLVFVNEEILSDNSKVYNVQIGNLILHAYNKEEADELAEKMSELINDHTTEVSDYIINY